jgi:ABC-type antimicrobial peptide transport system permease subunit
MEEVFSQAIGRPRLLAQLLLGFAVLALLMAAIGTYGVLAYVVAERRREIGIRMALGARLTDVLRLVLVQAGRLTAIGVGVGLLGAVALGRLMSAYLYGVVRPDLASLLAVTVLLAAVVLVATWIPARRAARVDPVVALREE